MWVALATLLLALGAWAWLGVREPAAVSGSELDTTEDAQRQTAATPSERTRVEAAESTKAKRKIARWTPPSRAEADALRAALRSRPQPMHTDAPPADAASAPPESGPGLRDRVGLDDATKAAFARDFMPLVGECIEMARERQPDLHGMLAIELGAAGDPDLGAVVDHVAFAERNEIEELELRECVEQSAWSLSLPPPPDAGREDLLLTIPVGEDD